MQLLICSSCKKTFGTRPPKKDIEDAKEALKTNIFLVARCPECGMLTRFKANPFDVKINILEGEYIGKIELNPEKPSIN